MANFSQKNLANYQKSTRCHLIEDCLTPSTNGKLVSQVVSLPILEITSGNWELLRICQTFLPHLPVLGLSPKSPKQTSKHNLGMLLWKKSLSELIFWWILQQAPLFFSPLTETPSGILLSTCLLQFFSSNLKFQSEAWRSCGRSWRFLQAMLFPVFSGGAAEGADGSTTWASTTWASTTWVVKVQVQKDKIHFDGRSRNSFNYLDNREILMFENIGHQAPQNIISTDLDSKHRPPFVYLTVENVGNPTRTWIIQCESGY